MSSLPVAPRRILTTFFVGPAIAILTWFLPASASDKSPELKAPESMEFVVNVGTRFGDTRILRIAIVLEYADDEASRRLSGYRPKLMHQILLVLSQQTSELLLSSKGKLELKQQIVRNINDMFRETEKTGVRDALLTDFLIQ